MLELRESGCTARFLKRWNERSDRILFVDYDGTLCPFVFEANRAFPYPGVRERLARLIARADTRVVVVSGRNARDLLPLLQMHPCPEIFGCHGWERMLPGEKPEVFEMPGAARQGLYEARAWLEHEGLNARGELKPSSVALHWRGLPGAEQQSLARRARAAWEPLTIGRHLELHDFDGGIELCATGRNKGDAVRIVMKERHGRNAAMAYLGDDQTDEDAFRALGDGGLKVLVRGERRETLADVWIQPPEELLEFLDAISQ